MPATSTITSFYSFTAGTLIRSSYVNNNFSTFRGHILPVDLTAAAAAATITYDLGASDHAWRYLYAKQVHFFGDTVGATPPTGYYSIYVKSTDGKAYKKNDAGTESGLGGGALAVTATPAAATTITAAGGITYAESGGERQLFYLIGATTTGTDVTANPQISVATATSYGLELILIGTSDTNTVILDDGNGLSLNGQCALSDKSCLGLLWNGSVWTEMFRRI